MAVYPWVPIYPSKSFLLSPFPTRTKFQSLAPCPPRKPRVNASSTNISQYSSSSPKGKNPLAVVLEVSRTIWRQTLQPMRDFGLGWRSIWEGGVGLFIVSGAVLFALTLVWLRGYRLRTRFTKYQAVFEFSQACGICVGTPIRIRGVTVGNVVHVNSSSKCIDVIAEIEAIAEDIQPLLVEVRSSTLLKDFEVLTKSLAEATRELRNVQDSVTNFENAKLIRSSIFSLIFTLKNIESITFDISGFTADEATRRNLKLLIKSLSRLL